jgi:DNA-binding MarR family transcriptional regulator
MASDHKHHQNAQEGKLPEPSSSLPGTQGNEPPAGAALYRDAETIEQSLRWIQHAMRYSIEADKRLLPLTPPQLQALIVLTHPDHSDGLTLKELSAYLGLAHSTVSGIIDRLVRQGLVRRVAHPTDRRARHIEVTEHVTQYLHHSLFARRLHPLLTALNQASEVDRKAIIEGLATLQRLFMLTHEQIEE